MLQSLQTYPAQIESLLTAVENSLQQAQTHLATNDRNSAVPYAKMAEETLSQAATLFTRIDAAPQELGAAKERFAANIASLTADISDANKLGHQNPLISEAKTVAEALISRAKSTTNPDYLALNAELKETEAKLDALLAPVREAAEVHQRLQENVKIVMHTAQDTITAADEFIHRYRSGVGANSRTLLARAKAHYQRAATAPLAQQITIYQEAISAAQQSMHTAERALSQEKCVWEVTPVEIFLPA
ncbi:hypothetical protein [Arcanobacterium hippocoleae]|uniref:hypothetical protein n=1 Tax=Arcanobacterium hippocoleae TaxID=149017 RepID=UPI0033402FBB